MAEKNEVNGEILKSALSNSRLDRHSMQFKKNAGINLDDLQIAVCIDKLTLVGEMSLYSARQFAKMVGDDPRFIVFDDSPSKFQAIVADNSAHLSFVGEQKNKLRVEFNPSKLTVDQKRFIRDKLVRKIPNYHFTRIDIALDLNMDLTSYYMFCDTSLSSNEIRGMVGELQTKYLGARGSGRYLRIYNKGKERDNAKSDEQYIKGSPWWRVEAELKRNKVNEWESCFDDLHLILAGWKNFEKPNDRAMVKMLLEEPGEWGRIDYRTRKKYKNMLLDMCDIDLNYKLRQAMTVNNRQIRNDLNYWIVF